MWTMFTHLVVMATVTMVMCESFTLVVKPKDIEFFYTQNVHLECNGQNYTSGKMHAVSRIRIAKLDTEGVWRNLAKLMEKDVKVIDDPNASGRGKLGKTLNSYFRLTWPLASESLRGKYRCDIVGLDVNGDFVSENTAPVAIEDNRKTISDVLVVLERQRAKAKVKFDSIKKQLLEASQRTSKIEIDKVQNHFNDQDNRLEKIESKVDELLSLYRLEKPVCDLDNFTVDFEADMWPYGYFGLLMPDSGCPVHTKHKWFTGTRQHLTNGHSKLPSYTHMAKPVTKGPFFFQRFCVINNTESTRAWPKGSYCLNRKRGYCPGGFDAGFMRYDDRMSGSSRSGVLPDGYYSSYTRIYYCCRHDGPPTTPIILPTYQPFYLYRYRGKCQRVMGMSATHEYFIIGTVHDDNGDSYNSRNHPDGKLNPVRIELCYYESETAMS